LFIDAGDEIKIPLTINDLRIDEPVVQDNE